MKVTLNIWRQSKQSTKQDFKQDGKMVRYELDHVSPDMSFLEMLDVLNEGLIRDGEEPVASGGAFEKVEKSSQAAVPEPEEAPDIFPLEGTLKRLFSAPFILARRSRTPPRPRPGAGAADSGSDRSAARGG